MTYKKLNKISGAALILLLIWLVILIGMAALVIDIGQLRLAKSKAQNAADAGALGGVRLLTGKDGSDGPAILEANTLALANNTLSPLSKVLSENDEIWITPGGDAAPYKMKVGKNQAIQVSCYVNVDYAFAPIFSSLLGESGLNSGSATAVATAMWIGVYNLSQNVMPWVMPQTQLWDPNGIPTPVGTQIPIKVGDNDKVFQPGNFRCVTYPEDGQGANVYRDRVAGILPPVNVKLGDVLDPLQGNKVGPTDKGLKLLIKDSIYKSTPCAFATWVAAGCPQDSRVVIIPVVQYPLPASGTLVVVGFAAFFICNEAVSGEVTGHFVTARLDGGTLVYGGTNLSNTGGTTLITSVRLVK